MAQLSLRGVRKSYEGRQILHDIDLDIGHGEFVVIVGPSGCGKTTLLRVIAGLEAVSGGDVVIDGTNVNHAPANMRHCAMVFQNYALYPHMSVRRNIAYPLRLAGVARAAIETRVAETSALLGLADVLDRRPNQLSGGQRQRVAMARAMVREPKVFLFDEPMSNLDAKLRIETRGEIRRLHKRLDATSIMVTHDQAEAMSLADRLVIMNGGRIEQVGAPAALYRAPSSRFVAAFLGAPAMNLIDALTGASGAIMVGEHSVDAGVMALAAGRSVTLGIRPEDIVVSQAGRGIPARVKFVEELGSVRIASCSLGQTEIALVLRREFVIDGDHLSLQFPREQVHVFDAGTGQRIVNDSRGMIGLV